MLAGAAALAALALVGVAVLFGARRGSHAPGTASSRAELVATGPSMPSAGGPQGPVQLAAPAAERLQRSDGHELEKLVSRDPELALARISATTPTSDADAQRLKVLEVRALVALRRIGSARSQAAAYYSRWPDGPDVALLERLTGRHPTPPR